MAGNANALTDISQIDGWVQRKLATIKGFPGLLDKERLVPIEEPIILNNPFVSPDPVTRNVNAFYSENQQADITAGQWTRIVTVGDGTCSIHALLLCTSPTYRRLPRLKTDTYREQIGQSFRREVISPFFKDYPQYNNLPVKYAHEADIFSKQFLDATSTFLEDIHIAEISRILKFNACVVRDQEGVVITTTKFMQSPGSPWIFLFNIFPRHYEAIYLQTQGTFLLADEDFFRMYHKYNIQSKIEALIYPVTQAVTEKVDEETLNTIRTRLLETDITNLSNMDKVIQGLVETYELDESLLRQYQYLRRAVSLGDTYESKNNSRDGDLYEIYLQQGRDTAEKEKRIYEEGLIAKKYGLNVRNYKEILQRSQTVIPHISLDEQINANARAAGLSRNAYLEQVRQKRRNNNAGVQRRAPPPSSAPPANVDPNVAEAAAFGMSVNNYIKAKTLAEEQERKGAANVKAKAELEKQRAAQEAVEAARRRAANKAAKGEINEEAVKRKKQAVAKALAPYGLNNTTAKDDPKYRILKQLASIKHTMAQDEIEAILIGIATDPLLKTPGIKELNADALVNIFNAAAGGRRNTRRAKKSKRKTRKA